MLDAFETAGGLTKIQGRRLVELAGARAALPWVRDDGVLQSLRLIQRSGWFPSSRLVEINAWGWSVALHVSTRTSRTSPNYPNDQA